MAYQQGGPWRPPEGSSSQFQNPHRSFQGIPQQFNNDTMSQGNRSLSGHQWTPPQHNNFLHSHNNYSVNFSHPSAPKFQNFPPPGPPPTIQNPFPNHPPNVPPPSYHQNVSCNFNSSSSMLSPAHAPRSMSTTPVLPPGLSFERPPPSSANTNYTPYAQPPPLRNPTTFLQFPPPVSGSHSLLSSKTKSHEPCNDKALGCQKLRNWLQAHKKSVKSEPKRNQEKDPVKVWNFLNRIKEMQEVISSLSIQVTQLTAVASTTDEPTWEASKNACDALKVKLSSEFEGLLDNSNLQEVRKKLTLSRRKRARMKKSRKAKFEQNELLQQEWDEKSKSIDKWQERLRLKIQEENKEKRRKAAADRTLSKVTREIQDATRLIDTMLGLEKLRLIRRDAAQKRGDSDIGESRQSFEEKIKDMTRLVKAQLECYKDEEAKLKQVLKTEEEEKSKLECQFREEKAKFEQEEEEAKLRSALFGSKEVLSHADPLFPFNQYYSQAKHNLSAFLHIRQEWDSYVVPKGTPASSCIPSEWVTPDPPCSSVWSAALQ